MMFVCSVSPTALMGVFLALTTFLVSSSSASSASDPLQHFSQLTAWLQEHKGFVSDKIEFRLEDNDLAVFAKEALGGQEILMVIPTSCLVRDDNDEHLCGTTRALLDDPKKYAPYLQVIKASPHGVLPDRWSEPARELLQTIVGDELLSPVAKRSFARDCGLNGDADVEDVFEWVLARSWNHVLVPLLDMIPLRNGKWHNVASTAAAGGRDIMVFTTRAVLEGEPLYVSFAEGPDREGNPGYGTTTDILRDMGHVEDYPQQWVLPALNYERDTEDLYFQIDHVEDEEQPKFQLTWLNDVRPDVQMLSVLTSQLRMLQGLKGYVESQVATLTSPHEQAMILKYYEALQVAMQYAMWSYYEDAAENQIAHENDEAILSYYDTLEKRPPIGNPYHAYPYTCHPRHLGIGRGYQYFYRKTSQYQKIEYTYGADEDDACIWLEDLGHACTGFRVYHEALVHYAASFLPQVRRVVYIGGGDNMILHEILKYPTIELVVGMELDQQVVRSSFRNLGTLPFFDDPRVEWWFGDASKTFRILPPSYFGSFDLVLVDLTNYAADMLSVTDTLSLMGSMKLLLSPNGIISKNEDFPNRKVNDFARYTVDMEYADMPQTCLQSITIGSNAVDFLTAPQYDHGVHRLYLRKTLDRETRFINAHGFRDNHLLQPGSSFAALEGSCSSSSATEAKEGKASNSSSTLSATSDLGVLVVMEVEELSSIVKTKKEFLGALTKALESTGIESVEHHAFERPDGSFDLVLLFRQGYLVLRKRPTPSNINYVGMDLHLWGGIDLLNSIKSRILANIGGKEEAYTSYHLVAGGIPGTINEPPYIVHYAEQQMASKVCQNYSADSTPSTEPVEESKSAVALSSIAPLVSGGRQNFIVLCGSIDEACESLDALKSISIDGVIIPLYACDGISLDDDSLFKCEVAMMKTIRETSESTKIQGVWLDSNAAQTTARVLLRLLTRVTGRAEVLDDGNYVIFTELLEEEEWRETFVERFRTEISPVAPAKEARLILPDGRRFSFFSAADVNFYNNLVDVLEDIKTKTGNRVAVEHVMSGYPNYNPDFEPEIFRNSDYDHTRSYKQWMSQKAIGYQVVFQLELQAPKATIPVGERVLLQVDETSWMGEWVEVSVTGVNEDGTYNVMGNKRYNQHVPRDKIRRLDFNWEATPPPQINKGARVLVRREKQSWVQGWVESRSDDGMSYDVSSYEGSVDSDIPLHDLIPEFELPGDEVELSVPSIEFIVYGLRNVLTKMLAEETNSKIEQKTHLVESGCVITAFWHGGSLVLIWDGSKHMDANFYLEKEAPEILDRFETDFVETIPFLARIARDEQPRGYGSLVNFGSEIRQDVSPIWWPDGEPGHVRLFLWTDEPFKSLYFSVDVGDDDDDDDDDNDDDEGEEAFHEEQEL